MVYIRDIQQLVLGFGEKFLEKSLFPPKEETIFHCKN